MLYTSLDKVFSDDDSNGKQQYTNDLLNDGRDEVGIVLVNLCEKSLNEKTEELRKKL